MRESDREQFREFVAARSAGLFRVAMALTGAHDAAEDLLQGALVRTFARWRQVRGDPEAYVRRAMYHAQVTVWRRRQRLRELPADPLPERPDQRDDIRTTDQRLALRQALLRLGPRQHAVLVARCHRSEGDGSDGTAGIAGREPGSSPFRDPG